MTSAEQFICQTLEVNLLNQREFPVKFYLNPQGYSHPCKNCGKKAIYRAEIHDHTHNPQHSEYYCKPCLPKSLNKPGD